MARGGSAGADAAGAGAGEAAAGAASTGSAGEGGAAGSLGAAGAGAAGGASGEGGAGGADPCNFGEASSAGTNEALNLFGEIVYFADGAVLPAGRYRAQFVDGCMKYASDQAWTVHAYANSSIAWWLVGDSSADQIVVPPGTVGYSTDNGAYAAFEECVAANLLLPPTEFDFAGGKLGVWLLDSQYTDNVAGVDDRNPKWKLTRVDCQ
jgi:hypothetical protein